MSEHDNDLVVVGGGVAGYTAAIAAARHRPSASVRLLSTAEDRFRSHSGLIDVLGYLPGGDDPVSNPLAATEQLPARHWYSKLGRERLWDALAVFDEATGGSYRGEHTEQNALFPTAVGRLKPASRYPAGMAAGVASSRRSMRLVGFDSVPDFDAGLAADRLELPYEVTATSVSTSVSVDSPPAALSFAETLDARIESGEGVRELAESLRPELDVEGRIGLPAVLGKRSAATIRAELEASLTVDIFEIPIGPPSVPGRRLESRLVATAEEAGVAVERGRELAGTEATDGEISAVRTDDGPVAGAAFVLATGGVRAGGLESTRSEIREPVFGCPVSAPSNRAEWVDEEFLGDHEIVRAGVETDDRLQPPAYSNLYAAGRVLETTNVIAEQSADGVAILTGYEAGRRAVEES